MKCKAHNWKKARMPCPWLLCLNGSPGHVIEVGKTKKVSYVRVRNKTAEGPVYSWQKIQ